MNQSTLRRGRFNYPDLVALGFTTCRVQILENTVHNMKCTWQTFIVIKKGIENYLVKECHHAWMQVKFTIV